MAESQHHERHCPSDITATASMNDVRQDEPGSHCVLCDDSEKLSMTSEQSVMPCCSYDEHAFPASFYAHSLADSCSIMASNQSVPTSLAAVNDDYEEITPKDKKVARIVGFIAVVIILSAFILVGATLSMSKHIDDMGESRVCPVTVLLRAT